MAAFSFSRTPHIVFGCGSLARLPELVNRFGSRLLLVTGTHALCTSGKLQEILAALRYVGVVVEHLTLAEEPSPQLVDEAVEALRPKAVQVVVAVGGGSALDAGKAISAMLPEEGSVAAFLEGIGDPERHSGGKVPFIAVPTTAGTGSEATKNAVLTMRGPGGFKKSLRHEHFVPEVALVDPVLSCTCPPELTAACGMDAFTQLLESYVSTNASPLTDLLAVQGMERVRDCLERAVRDGALDIQARDGMAYAALLSGLTLANAGLGIVHGLAGPLGALAPIPHGVACGTLLATATRMTIDSLRQADDARSRLALEKYGTVGALLTGAEGDVLTQCRRLVDELERWTVRFRIPRLGSFGLDEALLREVARQGENKNNPAALDQEQRLALLQERL
ncbi:MAG: iron-containing alcohol dehydrogenase [bacterium]|jgi:alcohol dehydrogenase class IV|nr:iron-containing alcohol dehydrogenase [candidate division KSB1 bacterium]MDH7560397.1 iron-containing alcohol dehydrogenase [bacterium]